MKTFWFGISFADTKRRGLFDILFNRPHDKALILFEFDFEFTLESVPGTNQY